MVKFYFKKIFNKLNVCFYKKPSYFYIKNLIKKFNFNKIKLNFIFVSLFEMFLISKYYKYFNFVSSFLLFKNKFSNIIIYNDIYICNSLIEYNSIFYFKDLNFFYTYVIIHSILHSQDLNHKKYFFKKNIFNYLEIKILKKIGFKDPYNNFL